MLDTVIRGGRVIDGTGSPPVPADVGIRGGRIVTIGLVDEPAHRTIAADGRVVSPGFVDVHTHLDAQAFWDPTLSPSPLHGVTTALAGNCGFSIAPLRASEADYCMRMLAKVEGMPLASLAAGVPWDWESTTEFLERIDSTLSVNIGFMVGHSALRRVVMGADGSKRAATGDEIRAMTSLLREGLSAGGLGFSSSWGAAHSDDHGIPVPSRWAEPQELIALATACRDFAGTSIEFLPQTGGEFTADVVDLMAAMSAAARRPLNWNVIFASVRNVDEVMANLQASDVAGTRGGRVVALMMPTALGSRFYSFHSGFVLDTLPGWSEVMGLPLEQRHTVLSDPLQRHRLDDLAQQADGDHQRRLARWGDHVIAETFTAQTKRYEGRLLGHIAAEEGKPAFDALLDIVCADGLRTRFEGLPVVDTDEDWQLRVELARDPRIVLGGSDAGAHLDYLGTFNYPTVFLAEAVRARRLLPLEEAVQYLTDVPARLYGLRDRGRLAEGAYADIVVFDEDAVGSEPLCTRFDLPGNAGRLYADATGIASVLVQGVEIVSSGSFTDDRPGWVLRSGRDTVTPALG